MARLRRDAPGVPRPGRPECTARRADRGCPSPRVLGGHHRDRADGGRPALELLPKYHAGRFPRGGSAGKLPRGVTKLLSLLLGLATAGTSWAASGAAPRQLRVPLQIGGVVPELLDPGLQDLTIGLMKQAKVADVGRITVTWQKGQT